MSLSVWSWTQNKALVRIIQHELNTLSLLSLSMSAEFTFPSTNPLNTKTQMFSGWFTCEQWAEDHQSQHVCMIVISLSPSLFLFLLFIVTVHLNIISRPLFVTSCDQTSWCNNNTVTFNYSVFLFLCHWLFKHVCVNMCWKTTKLHLQAD